jgi:ATP-binding cassette subfamily B (MDR/TAP) protein 1
MVSAKFFVRGFRSSCSSSFGIVFGYVLQIYSSPDRSYIRSKGNFYALLLFIIAIVSTVAILAQGYAFGRAAEVMSRKLRARTLATILQQDVQFFDEEENSSGSLTSQVADHAQSINPMVGSTAGVIVQNVFTLIAGCMCVSPPLVKCRTSLHRCSIGLVFLPKLAAVGIAVIPFSLAAGITRLYFVVLSEKNQKTAHQESAQLATEGTAAIRTVASLTREDDALRIYSEKLDQAAAYTFKTAIYSNALYSISQGLS